MDDGILSPETPSQPSLASSTTSIATGRVDPPSSPLINSHNNEVKPSSSSSASSGSEGDSTTKLKGSGQLWTRVLTRLDLMHATRSGHIIKTNESLPLLSEAMIMRARTSWEMLDPMQDGIIQPRQLRDLFERVPTFHVLSSTDEVILSMYHTSNVML
jgi:hypothetical protein